MFLSAFLKFNRNNLNFWFGLLRLFLELATFLYAITYVKEERKTPKRV